VGVDAEEAWPYLLNAMNFGMPGCSTDFIARTALSIVQQHRPDTVYILWPDWSRFEYIRDGYYRQCLLGNRDRIEFMATHTEEWCKNNFQKQVRIINNICKDHNVQLISLSLDDLTKYIDHADRWPLSKLGHHYSPVWHQQIANIFLQNKNTIKND
jgi:hypothetical protein